MIFKIILIILTLSAGCMPGEIEVERMYNYDFENDINVNTIEEALEYVYLKMVYERDSTDYWQLPEESYRKGKGDCEDYAIFFMYLCKSKLDIDSTLVFLKHETKGHHVIAKIDNLYYSAIHNYIIETIGAGWEYNWECDYEEAIWMTYYYHDSVGVYE